MLPPGVVLAGVLLITLAYFAVVDFLYVGRLAAYVAIMELPEAPPVPIVLPSASILPTALSIPTATGIDRDELILSDVGPSTQQSALSIQPADSIDRDEPILSDIQSDVLPPKTSQD